MVQNKISKIFFSIFIVAIFIFGICQSVIYAAGETGKTIKLDYYRYISNGSEGYKSTNNGYAIVGNPTHPVFQILSVDNNDKVLGTNFYCLSAEAGSTWVSGTINTGISYSKNTDLVSQKSSASTILPDSIYTQVMWILDNMYTPDGTMTIEELLAKAGINYEDSGATDTNGNSIGKHYYYSGTKIGSQTFSYDNDYGFSGYMIANSSGEIEDVILSKELVETIQQSAIWYFTNYIGKSQSLYNNYDEIDRNVLSWLKYAEIDTNGQITWKNLYSSSGITSDEQKSRMLQEQASILYNYFVDSAKSAAQNGYVASAEGTIDLSYTSDTTIEKEETNYVIGPMKVTTTGNVTNLNIEVKTGTSYGTTIDSSKITLKDKDGSEITKISEGKEFYVVIPQTSVSESIQVTVSGTSTATTKTLWMDTAGIEQPIAEVKKESKTITDNLTVALEKLFDLALRKQIIAVNGVSTEIINENELDATRRMDIKVDTIPNTATYKHRKDPVVVTTGSTVTYKISIYNEGDIDGYASIIVDQLPVGLIMSDTMNNTVTSTKGNTYTVTFDEIKNQIILTLTGTAKNLSAYNGTLDSDSIEVICEIKQIAETDGKTKHYLTNIAYIAEEYDKDGNKITQDRNGTESSPSISPDKTASDLNNENADEYKGNSSNPSIYDDTNNSTYYEGQEDDDDFETVVILPERFDLALRKFISAVSTDGNFSSKNTKTYNREPSVDTSELNTIVDKNLITTATYNHSKEPIAVKVGDYVLYTIRVYNEGNIAGISAEITDYLPEYLDFVDSTDEYINSINSLWTYDSTSRKVKTTQLKDTVLEAFNKATDDGKGSGLSYADVKIICKVNKNAIANKNITNIAEISQYADENGEELPDGTDIDSDADDLKYPDDESIYKDDEIKSGNEYIPGQEDDDDFEKVVVLDFDLALRKFITNISDQDVTTRIPQVNYKDDKITYEHPKDVVKVVAGDTVTYTIRVYNEGKVSGYAQTVTDDIPEYLEYLPENSTNKEYRWKMYNKDGEETSNVKDAVKIVTDYTSKEYGEELMKANSSSKENPNLLKAFDSKAETSDTNPDYVDVKVAFKVLDPNSNTHVIINKAQISEDADEEGNPVDDIDSVPDKWNDGEDDQDYENVSVEYFDLALLKYVSTVMVTEKGTTTTTKTGNTGAKTDIIPKVEVNKNRVNTTIVKFGYTIKITNEGDIAGYAKEITDYVPEGLKFYKEDNNGWKDEGNNVISTNLLENTLLKPGESATVTVVLRWINGEKNLGVKTNVAEISKDYNEKDVPDRDSTPDNKKDGEDDIDDASVLLSISTGIIGDVMPYIAGSIICLVVLAGGIVAIKRYVL